MAVLIRQSDDTHFILQAYRERVARSKRALLEQRIRLLAEQHGQYAHIFSADAEQLEIAFSADAGYLMGETVWEYFGKSQNLIFCEILPGENNQVLLVAVVNGSIYLDTQVANENLQAELLPLLTKSSAFRVVTSGAVSLQENLTPNGFTLPATLVASFETLREPLFPRLVALERCRLQPLPILLRSKLLGWRKQWLNIPAVIVIALLLVWALYPKPQPVVVVSPPAPVDNFGSYYKALMTPLPRAQLQELTRVIKEVYLLPGWQVQGLAYANSSYQIRLARDGGDINWLTAWAKHKDYQLNLTPNGVQLVLVSPLPKRAKPRHIYPAQQVANLLMDRLRLIIDDQSVVLGPARQFGKTQQLDITINLNDASPSLVLLLSDVLRDDLPLEIISIQVSSLNTGLINGVIQLSIWGS